MLLTPMTKMTYFRISAYKVWTSVPNFKKQSAVSTWLYRIALNTTFKWIRKEKKFNKEKDQNEMGHILYDPMTESDDRLDWLYSEIKKLDEVDRSITLLMLDGYSYKEMAEMLGITAGNIGVKINRIKKHLITQSEQYEKQAG